MSPEKETWEAAKKRLQDLDHAVTEAEAAIAKSPADVAFRQKLEMVISIRDAARTDLTRAEAALAASGTASSGDA